MHSPNNKYLNDRVVIKRIILAVLKDNEELENFSGDIQIYTKSCFEHLLLKVSFKSKREILQRIYVAGLNMNEINIARDFIKMVEIGGMTESQFCEKECINDQNLTIVKEHYVPPLRKHIESIYPLHCKDDIHRVSSRNLITL
ncbi:MAG: hypothetical protein N2749_05005 [Clostridia bacterium]|nr:hypothetical protein [Clostridia bacterium]